VLRSICAVALLGSCGLMTPARKAVVPFLDFVMLRNFSGDSPLEGRSAFAMEMAEMRCGACCCTCVYLFYAWCVACGP
jgi:DNA mismatch repair ATPase MutS